MKVLRVAAVAAMTTSASVLAAEENSFTDQNGARYTVLFERPFTETLKAQMIEIINGDSAMLVEMGVDCVEDKYAYLGMTFDLPVDAPREDEADKVIAYSNSLLTDRIGGLSLTQLDANLENDSVVKLFDLGCGRR